MALLEVNSLTAFYGDFQALYGVSLSVDEGQAVAVIGANGAGKSTLLKSIVGMIRATPGMIHFDGEPIGGIRSPKIVARGVTMVPEGRRLFSSLTVEENLRIGGQLGRPGPWTLQRVLELFPMLAERRSQPSTSLSGGQQQMVAIGRHAATISAGEWITASGEWVNDRTHGQQFRAKKLVRARCGTSQR